MHIFVNHTGSRTGRRYAVWLQQNLLSQWTPVRLYGGAYREEGERLLGQVIRVHLRHGYVEVVDVLQMNDD